MPKKVLMIAFHYPPIQGSSGVHRTQAFSKYLPDHSWQPAILTATKKAYADWREENEALIPENVHVIRAFARDVHSALSIRGRYFKFTAVPDRWNSWILPAIVAGYRFIKREKPAVIYSTYPIPSAHVIGLVLHKLTGLPWVADFRDPMYQDGFPQGWLLRRAYRWIERKTVQYSSLQIFTTPGAVEQCATKYPELNPKRIRLIENGYEEEIFDSIAGNSSTIEFGENVSRKVMLHSGLVYTQERDPTALFEALSVLKNEKLIAKENFCLVLRGSGSVQRFETMLCEKDIEDLVSLEPPVGYRSAIEEMMTVDALLVLQASNCNQQIPAKAYEYLRCKRPILALTDKAGDTARLLINSGISSIAALDDVDEIVSLLKDFMAENSKENYVPIDDEQVRSMSRRGRTAELAKLLDLVAAASKVAVSEGNNSAQL